MKEKLEAYADMRDEGVSVIIREALKNILSREKVTGSVVAETTAHYGPLVSPETLLEDAKRNLRNSASITANSSKVKKASA